MSSVEEDFDSSPMAPLVNVSVTTDNRTADIALRIHVSRKTIVACVVFVGTLLSILIQILNQVS